MKCKVLALLIALISVISCTIEPENLNVFWENPDFNLAGIAMSNNHSIYCRSDSTLFAINSDGVKEWEFILEGNDTGWSSASVGDDGTIYVGGEEELYAINSDGTKKWEFPVDGGSVSGSAIKSGPAIDENGNIYVVAYPYLYS